MKQVFLLATLLSSYVFSAQEKFEFKFQTSASPGGINIVGISSTTTSLTDLIVVGDKLSGKLTVDLTTLETGIKLRDKHMKEKYLETALYKEASFELSPVSMKEIEKASLAGTEMALIGQFTLHGKTLPLTVSAHPKLLDGKLKLELKSKIKMTDFGITVPEFLGIKVKDEVEIESSYTGKL